MRAVMRIPFVLGLTLFFVACGGGGSESDPVQGPPPSAAPLTVTVDIGVKKLNFSWTELPGSTHYRLLENADGNSGFTQVGADIPAGTLSVSLAISVHMFDFAGALFIVEGCDANGCTGSSEVTVMNDMIATIGLIGAPNSSDPGSFGLAIALSADGKTMAVAAFWEGSNATGINGDQNDSSAPRSGAVYVFRYDDTDWLLQAYVKASNAEGGDAPGPEFFSGDEFGTSIALSADGNTLAVGAQHESSNATGIGGDQNDNSLSNAGAAYVFRFDGADWFQQAYVKASNTEGDSFASSVTLSADGNTLAVGAHKEDSSATGINGDQANNAALNAGAVYVFRFNGTDWFQQAYVKASNTNAEERFGRGITLSENGNTLAVGVPSEDSATTGIDGSDDDDTADDAGAVYVYRFDGTNWFQQAYIKASNTDAGDGFGSDVALSADGGTLVVGAPGEQSIATGINGDQNDNSTLSAGAVYVFRFDGANWFQHSYVKASNTNDLDDQFGGQVAMSADGAILAVTAKAEGGCSAGVGGDQNDTSCPFAGAAYIYRFDGTSWAQISYVKASNSAVDADFGVAVALSADGNTLAVGSTDDAVYVY